MFEIQICALSDVYDIIETWKPTRIVSVLPDKMPNYGEHHLQLKFDDVHTTTTDNVHPIIEDIFEIFAFTDDLTDDDRLLIHCFAGMSRSTSVAIAILIRHGMSYEDAFNHVKSIRPSMIPNLLITKYTDDYFGLQGCLHKMAMDKWNKSDYTHLLKIAGLLDMHPLAISNNQSGANGMKAGDRVVHDISGQHGIADEFLSDGDTYVTWDDGSFETVKWNNLIPEKK